MTLLPPNTQDPPSEPIGGSTDLSIAGPGPAETGPDLTAASVTTFRSKRGPDYRLRGLDLGAPVVEAPVPPVRKERPRRRHRRRLLIEWIVFLIVATLVALQLRASVVQPYSVPSASMVPTLAVGDRILVLKSGLLSGNVKTGELVVFRRPEPFNCGAGGARDLVARVIGLPGETIWSAGDTIYLDGRRLEEPGWYNPPFGQLGQSQIAPAKIPPGAYFVMGDNRTDTCDSRTFGPIRGSSVVGKVMATVLRSGHPHVRFW